VRHRHEAAGPIVDVAWLNDEAHEVQGKTGAIYTEKCFDAGKLCCFAATHALAGLNLIILKIFCSKDRLIGNCLPERQILSCGI
jgi:hypothetical protein